MGDSKWPLVVKECANECVYPCARRWTSISSMENSYLMLSFPGTGSTTRTRITGLLKTNERFVFLSIQTRFNVQNPVSKISKVFPPRLIKHLMSLERVQTYLPLRAFILEGFSFTFFSEAILLEWKLAVLFWSRYCTRTVNDKLQSFPPLLFLLHSCFPQPCLLDSAFCRALSSTVSEGFWYFPSETQNIPGYNDKVRSHSSINRRIV